MYKKKGLGLLWAEKKEYVTSLHPMYPLGAIVALSGPRVSVTVMLCFVLGKSYLVSTEFSEGTDVDVEQNFVEMGDIELPDPVQCGSEFCVICNELAAEQR